jgi:hypothetical protein
MKKTPLPIPAKDFRNLLSKPEWYKLPFSWTDCIEPNVFLSKQRPCQNKKCPSEHCNRARNSRQYQYLLINYSIRCPDYFVVFKFTPDSDILSENELVSILQCLRPKLRHISRYRGKGQSNLTFSFDLKVEFDDGQPHFHLTLSMNDDTHDSHSAEVVKHKLRQAFQKSLISLYDSGEIISEIRPAPVYFEPFRGILEGAKYLAKAEKYLCKHEPVPLNYSLKRKRLYSSSRDHHAVSRSELAQLKNDLWAKKMELKKTSALINENCNLQPKMQETPQNQKTAPTNVNPEDVSESRSTFSQERMMNRIVMPWFLFKKMPCFDKQPVIINRRGLEFVTPSWFIRNVYDVQFLE